MEEPMLKPIINSIIIYYIKLSFRFKFKSQYFQKIHLKKIFLFFVTIYTIFNKY